MDPTSTADVDSEGEYFYCSETLVLSIPLVLYASVRVYQSSTLRSWWTAHVSGRFRR